MPNTDTPFDHVVLLSIDTLRADAIAANPNKLWPKKYPRLTPVPTPGLDRLASRGTFFTNCVTAAPYTSASHGSILTGLWPLKHGVFEEFRRPLQVETTFSYAKRLGYQTLLKADFPLILGDLLGFTRDVDRYLVEDDDGALDGLRSAPRTFSCVHFGGVHMPYGFHNLRFGGEDYEDKVIQLEREVGTKGHQLVDQLVETYRDARDTNMLLRYKAVVGELYRSGAYERIFELYLDGVRYFLERRLDSFLERLHDVMAGKVWLGVLVGDHGEEFDRESYGHFNSLAEGVLRVPAIFFGPHARPGMYHDRVRTIDVGATLLDALGASIEGNLDGRSLLGTVLGNEEAVEPSVAYAQAYIPETARFVEFQQRMLSSAGYVGDLPHYLFQEAVYSSDWKLRRKNYTYGPEGSFGPLQVCDPKLDLERITPANVEAANNPNVATELTEKLDAYNALRSGQHTTGGEHDAAAP